VNDQENQPSDDEKDLIFRRFHLPPSVVSFFSAAATALQAYAENVQHTKSSNEKVQQRIDDDEQMNMELKRLRNNAVRKEIEAKNAEFEVRILQAHINKKKLEYDLTNIGKTPSVAAPHKQFVNKNNKQRVRAQHVVTAPHKTEEVKTAPANPEPAPEVKEPEAPKADPASLNNRIKGFEKLKLDLVKNSNSEVKA
jgi:hypothetical protein